MGEFSLNGITWKVKLVEPNHPILKRNNTNVYTFGCTDRDKRTIYVSRTLSGNLFERVMLHEICHCAMFSYNYYLPLEQEEFICEFVSKHSRNILSIYDNLFDKIGEYNVY